MAVSLAWCKLISLSTIPSLQLALKLENQIGYPLSICLLQKVDKRRNNIRGAKLLVILGTSAMFQIMCNVNLKP